MEIIQITEEQAKDMYVCLCGSVGGMESRIEVLRKKGFIKQSVLEKAKEAFIKAANLDDLLHIKYRLLIKYSAELEKALEGK